MNESLLKKYVEITGEEVIGHLYQLSAFLRGAKVVHVNSTREGGGVAEILQKLVPLQRELGIDSSWEVIAGNDDFYRCTKGFHNALQGRQVPISRGLLDAYEETNRETSERLASTLEEADFVFIHDPQPAPLLGLCEKRRGRWIWRCHINISHPFHGVWKYLRDYLSGYDASIFSMAEFSRQLPHPQYIIPPSIDPLSEKNIELGEREVAASRDSFNIDPVRPMMLQVSRFDSFKDPIGVINAYALAKNFAPNLQLVLAGGEATDDPEGSAVLAEVQEVAEKDDDIFVLLLPPDAHRTVNALQRTADIVLQKSIKEGFGLTVTEALWKGKPVIGGNTGGIRLQIFNHHTGFLVNTPEGAALRTRYLLHHQDKRREMGSKAREFVRENFLITRLLREHLTLMVGMLHGAKDRITLS